VGTLSVADATGVAAAKGTDFIVISGTDIRNVTRVRITMKQNGAATTGDIFSSKIVLKATLTSNG